METQKNYVYPDFTNTDNSILNNDIKIGEQYFIEKQGDRNINMHNYREILERIRKLEVLDFGIEIDKCSYYFSELYRDDKFFYYRGNVFVGNRKVIPVGGYSLRYTAYDICKDELTPRSVYRNDGFIPVEIPDDMKMPTEYDYY